MSSAARPSPWYARAISALVFFVLYIPLAVLVIYSFLKSEVEGGPLNQWTLDWFRLALSDPELQKALGYSFWIGIGCTIGSTIVGTSAAFALERAQFPGKKIIDVLTLVPLVMPEIVMALSLLIWFVFLRLSLGSLSIILAHITFSFSYVIITVRTRLKDFDHSVEEAAKDLGATPAQTFWKVTLPLITPAVVSGALMAFTLSFDDFLITFFTAGVGTDTLPIKLYSMIKYGVSPQINALSTMILVVTALLVLIAFRPRRHGQKKSESSASDAASLAA